MTQPQDVRVGQVRVLILLIRVVRRKTALRCEGELGDCIFQRVGSLNNFGLLLSFLLSPLHALARQLLADTARLHAGLTRLGLLRGDLGFKKRQRRQMRFHIPMRRFGRHFSDRGPVVDVEVWGHGSLAGWLLSRRPKIKLVFGLQFLAVQPVLKQFPLLLEHQLVLHRGSGLAKDVGGSYLARETGLMDGAAWLRL